MEERKSNEGFIGDKMMGLEDLDQAGVESSEWHARSLYYTALVLAEKIRLSLKVFSASR